VILLRKVLIPISSPLGLDVSRKRFSELRTKLNWLDVDYLDVVSSVDEINNFMKDLMGFDIIISMVMTGGTEHLILKLAESRKPILLLTTMFFNSYPAAIEAMSKLNNKNYPALIADIENRSDILKKLHILETLLEILGMKIILVGEPSPWLVYSLPNEKILKEKFNIDVIKVDIKEFLKRIEENKPSDTILSTPREKFTSEVNQLDLEKIGKIHLAIEESLNIYNSSIFSIRCFDLIGILNTTPCLSLSYFNDMGITAGCEGDIPATIAMHILSKLSKKPAFMANLLKIEDKKMYLAHCTIATKLTKDFILRTHFESRLGIGVQGYLDEGQEVTILRLSPNMDKAYVGIGTIIKGEPWSENLCRTQIIVELDKEPKNLIRKPMGNHQVVGFGNLVNELESLFNILQIELLHL